MTDAREALVAVLWEKFGAWPNGPLAAWLTKADCARFADAILASFDVAPPGERVKPSVEDVARALFERAVKAGDAIPHRSVFEADARAVLALFPGRTEAEVKAEAWDEGLRAGEAFERARWQWSSGATARIVNGLVERPERPTNPYRADRIEKEADRG